MLGLIPLPLLNITKLLVVIDEVRFVEKSQAVAETEYIIEVAVAGFSEDELEVEVVDGELVIKGETNSNDVDPHAGNYLHQGIAARNFTRTFAFLSAQVSGATVKNGILTVHVVVHIPESTKKKIAITFQK